MRADPRTGERSLPRKAEAVGFLVTNEQENANMLVAYEVAVELLVELRPLHAAIRIESGSLADQLQRAANSVVANLAEGQRREKGNKHRAFEIAHGEAREVLGCLDCARAWGWVSDDRAARAKLDRLLGLCWGLTHPKRARSRSSS